jgi:hypothetical protein
MQAHRGDIVSSLVHLTKENGDTSALDVLCKILNDGVIRGSGNSGFVKGPNSASCFTETPLSALKHFATEEKDPNKARYRYYGVAISKETGFDNGARPVIYLPDNEASWIPEDQKWRHVQYKHREVDWTYEREWRIKGDFDLTKSIGLYIICSHSNEVKAIKKSMNDDVAAKVRGFLPMIHLNKML